MDIKKVLVFRASSIGDCLMAKYFLENIHAIYPEARCGILIASRGQMIRELLAAYPWIEIVEANRRHPLSILRAFIRFWRSDIVVTQYSEKKFSTTSKIFGWLVSKKGGFIGFEDGWRWNKLLYDKVLSYDGKIPNFWNDRAVLEAAGVPVTVNGLSLKFLPMPEVPGKLGLQAGKYIVVHLFSGYAGRGLTEARQREIVEALSKEFGGDYKIVLTGGKGEAQAADVLAADIPSVMNAAGKTNVQELINLIHNSAAMVSLDTGAAHIAAQTGTPLVTLGICFSMNWWDKRQYPGKVQWLSATEACHFSHHGELHPSCLNEIPVQKIIRELRAKLAGGMMG